MKLNERKTFHSIVPYSSHVTDGIIKTVGNDFVSSWQLSGVSFECDSILNSDIFNHQTHNFLKSFASENVTFYVHVIRQQQSDRFHANSNNDFANKISDLYYQGMASEAFMINKLYFTLVFSPGSKIENAQLKKLTLEERKRSAVDIIDE